MYIDISVCIVIENFQCIDTLVIISQHLVISLLYHHHLMSIQVAGMAWMMITGAGQLEYCLGSICLFWHSSYRGMSFLMLHTLPSLLSVF